jgi:hypothetical protein
MVDANALLDLEALMDNDLEPECVLVEGARACHVMGGEANVIYGHLLWFAD